MKESSYVSRGALKLKSVLKYIKTDFKDKVVIDIGSSHGGFTHFALINGAKKVYCVDVGKGLLDWKLRNLDQVTVMEGVNARNLTKEDFKVPPHIGLIDVSFISIKKILPAAFEIVEEEILALIKPQFEAGYNEVSKGAGVVTDPEIQTGVIEDIKNSAKDERWRYIGTYPSAVTGRKGNQEYFIYYERI